MMDRRRFLAGVGAALLLPPGRGARVPQVETVGGRPVSAVLVGTGGRSEPVVFDGARPVDPLQVGRWVPVPPLDFRAPRAGTVTHVELSEGPVTEIVRLDPERAVWSGDRVRVSGLVWRG